MALIYKNNNSNKNSLIICPNSLIFHWKNECSKYINNKLIKP